MVDIYTVCVCHCGERFPSDRQLNKHIYEPFGPSRDDLDATSLQLSAVVA